MANSKKKKEEIVLPQDILSEIEIPDDILSEIFSFLPPKSVGKFRCLSKQWLTRLSTPAFLKSHHQRKPDNENLILLAPWGSVHSIANIKNDIVSRELPLTFSSDEFVGSVDGLVLLEHGTKEKFLVNPITLQHFKIPDPPLSLKEAKMGGILGFGYDRNSDDYKIVRLSCYFDSDDEDEPERRNDIVHVYSVKKGEWERVNCRSSYYDFEFELPCGAAVNGAVHWFANRQGFAYPHVIVAFNLSNNKLNEIPAPIGVDLENCAFNSLGVLGGCLFMIDGLSNRGTDIWIMKEYDVEESWTKFSVDVECHISKVLCFIGDEEVYVLSDEGNFVVCNLKDGTFKEIVVDGVPARLIDGGTFVESLFWPSLVGT